MKTILNIAKLTLLASALMACVAITLMPKPANAAPIGFCDRYANAAVSQYSKNLNKGCGYAGWRWHAWRKGHYNWCRGTNKAAARSERFTRWAMLKQC